MAALPKYRLVRKPPQGNRPAAAARGPFPPQAFANLAHELRTPIQVLLGCIEMLREEIADDIRNDIIERMNCNVQNLAETVENVTDFAQYSIGEEPALEENVEIAELLEEIAPMLAAANRGKGLAIRIDLDAAPPIIRTRRRALHSIISNLASNAIKFTQAGSVSIRLSRTRLRGCDAVKLVVNDSGPGIPPQLIGRAFQPMEQLSNSNTREHRGLGLGLAIVRCNLHVLAGSINVSSEPGHGSEVTVMIPCRIPDPV